MPQYQRSKGRLIVTAALELSTNQITHFYSPAKNTSEMVKLLHRLVNVYADEECIYFSWDAASWHASKALYASVQEINMKGIGHPQVKLVPLPSCAQFLNVIESVFSGMAKAIIHNSDFPSSEAAQDAIDKYIAERNEQFGQDAMLSIPHLITTCRFCTYSEPSSRAMWSHFRFKASTEDQSRC